MPSTRRSSEDLGEPLVQFHCRLPASIVARFNEYTMDPVRNKPKYGERSRIMTALLTQWMDTLDKNREGPTS